MKIDFTVKFFLSAAAAAVGFSQGRRKRMPPQPPTVCSSGFYKDISNQHQVQQYKSFEGISIKVC